MVYLGCMEISFFDPQDFDSNVKATIHTTGKLGFTDAAIRKLKLNEKKGIKIGHNTTNKDDKNLYVVFADELSEGTFRINKAGAYYYVNTKTLFDDMDIPYKTKRISFDIVPTEINGMSLYKFMYKEKLKTDDKEDDKADDLL
jgi:hypothetical protein